MLKINKDNEPEFFLKFKVRVNPRTWDDFSPIRHELRKYILENEQNNFCTYCEGKISSENIQSEIDHIKPKASHRFPKLFDVYVNLTVSCKRRNQCGEKKGSDWIDNFVHPVIDNPEEEFSYSADGKMNAGNEKGEHTIQFLGLNNSYLVRVRQTIASQLESYRPIENYSVEEIIYYFSSAGYPNFIKAIYQDFAKGI